MSEQLIYKDKNKPVEDRVNDLIARMTIKEQLGQMVQADSREYETDIIHQQHIGSFLHCADERIVEFQKAAEKTRLGIPLIFGIDAIHGHGFWPGATVFPTQLGVSCSWNPDIVKEMGRVTAREMVVTGLFWTFAPVLCLARDLRWGRINETFGEDSYLLGKLGAALVKGLQGEDLGDQDSVLACAKHFVGYSETQGGRDASEADLTERKLRNYFLPPFKDVCDAGVASYMTGYQSIDGVPNTISKKLMTDILRDEWGFEGFVVTDWNNVGRLHEEQNIFQDKEDCAIAAVEAGNDMMMTTPFFFPEALKALESGRLDKQLVENACRRILTLKFKLGLFDDRRYPDFDRQSIVIGSKEHRQAALTAARESIVLLKNENILPFAADKKRIGLIGPNADDIMAQLGDWSLGTGQVQKKAGGHPRETIVTLLDGLKQEAPEDVEINYIQGCEIMDDSTFNPSAAVDLAKNSDLVIMALGDTIPLIGETCDTATLELYGKQNELFKAVAETGVPIIVVLINSKPLAIPHIIDQAAAVIEAFNPGMLGGQALAEIIFGKLNPSGKLTISFARHVGQLPVYYNQIPGWHTDRYADMTAEPLFPFGFGLSYNRYDYDNLRLSNQQITAGQSITVSVDITNTGNREGIEIVQLYIQDLYSSVTTPIKILKNYARVFLNPGEVKTVEMELIFEDLALINAKLEKVVEPGDFEVMVGASSRDEDLLKAILVVPER
jgi:beta-glucosidase